MPLHPQAAQFVEQWLAAAPPRVELSTPQVIRDNMRAAIVAQGYPGRLASVVDQAIPGPVGLIPGRIYRSQGPPPQPALVYFHGGGWVAGDIDTHDNVCRALADASRATVISVDYRLAPEHPFPAAAEDAYAATQWVQSQAAELGIDPRQIAVAGDSAGGNLAAVVALMARDRGAPQLIGRQILIYPITDAELSTTSYEQYAEGHLLTRSAMQWFWEQYVPRAADRYHPYVAPLRAEHLTDLPPALVITAECDVLRDEGEAYARRLSEAGVPTQLSRYDGMIHGFIHRITVFDAAQHAVAQIAAAINVRD